jgi:hypothetical protein
MSTEQSNLVLESAPVEQSIELVIQPQNRALRNSRQEYQLPYEQHHRVPEEIIAIFEVEIDLDSPDNFNDLGYDIPRDNNNLVGNDNELVVKFNEYAYKGSPFRMAGGISALALTAGAYYFKKRKVIPSAHFGYYTSSGRDLLKPAGVHTLIPVFDEWREIISADIDQTRENPMGDLKRRLGSKTILNVFKNYAAGANKISREVGDDEGSTGNYVIFGEGRHVLKENMYNDIQIIKLKHDNRDTNPHVHKLGPLTFLYVKEGFLGGTFERKFGKFRILYPGQAYVMNDADFENITLVKRTLQPYRVGPIHYVTVTDGRLGGAYILKTGRYQILPPGNCYQLHSKEYEGIQVVDWKVEFELGPYNFITVREGFVANTFYIREGRYVNLPPGHTYQLNKDDYIRPVMKKKNNYIIECGPYTYLSVRDDILAGAYRTANGTFEEFTDTKSEYILHQKEYYGVVTIPKYSIKSQDFGPNKVITIPEGYVGIFENKGKIEIKQDGFYKVPCEYKIKSAIPTKMLTYLFKKKEFKTQDGITMAYNATLVWQVNDPMKVAKFNGVFSDLIKLVLGKTEMNMIKICQTYDRSKLKPTKQDVMVRDDLGELSDEELEQMIVVSSENTTKLYSTIEKECLEILQELSASSDLGVEFKIMKLDGFELLDQQIIDDLSAITQSLLATKAQKVKKSLTIAQAEVTRAELLEKEKTHANVNEMKMESDSRIRKTKAQADSEIQIINETNKAKAEMESEKIKLEMKKQRVDTDAAIKEKQLDMKLKEAETDAANIERLAKANYEKVMSEKKAAATMSDQEFKLKQYELMVVGLENYGKAAWTCPEQFQEVAKNMYPFLRIGPTGAKDFFESLGMKKTQVVQDE